MGTAIITLTFLRALSISVFQLAGYGAKTLRPKTRTPKTSAAPSPAPGE